MLITVTTSNYSAFANMCTQLLTMTHTTSSAFFTGHCLVSDASSVLFCSCHYQLGTVMHLTHCLKCPDVPQFSLYNGSTDCMDDTTSNNGVNYCIHICFYIDVSIESLPCNGHIIWLHYSDFQLPCLNHCLLILWLVRPVESSCRHQSAKIMHPNLQIFDSTVHFFNPSVHIQLP